VIWWLLDKLGWARVDLKTEVIGYDYVEFAKNFDFTGKRLVKRKEAHKELTAVEDFSALNQSHEGNDDFDNNGSADVGAEVAAPKKSRPQEVQVISKF